MATESRHSGSGSTATSTCRRSSSETVTDNSPSAVVLLSGGLDSATLLSLMLKQGSNAQALHVSYGQSAQRREREAAGAVADHFDIPLRLVEYRGASFG